MMLWRCLVAIPLLLVLPAFAAEKVPYSKKSAAQGKQVFLRMCASCHGNDGKSAIDVVADATDLTDPKAFKNGTTDAEIFKSIRDGQGASMPAFKSQIKSEEDLWHLVNFIQSLWPNKQE